MLTREAPPYLVPVVVLLALGLVLGAGFRAMRTANPLKEHNAAVTRANCIGKCHTEIQIAALIAKKNDVPTHLKWAPVMDDPTSNGPDGHSHNAEVVAILNNYFQHDAPQK